MAELPPTEYLQQLLAGYTLGDLSPEEAEELQQLLTAHPEMHQELQQLQEVLAAIPYALPEAMPAPQVRSQMMQAIALPPPARRSRRVPFWRVIGSVAALLLVALVAERMHLQHQLNTTQANLAATQTQLAQQEVLLANRNAQVAQQQELVRMLQDPNAHLVALKGMDKMPSASGNVVMMPGETEVVVVLRDLPTLPADKSYQLWSVVNGQKLAAGRFNTDQKGTTCIKLPLPEVDQLSEVMVTVETSTVSKSLPTGPMVMTSSL
jgi:anti-sigma-K factor RskA